MGFSQAAGNGKRGTRAEEAAGRRKDGRASPTPTVGIAPTHCGMPVAPLRVSVAPRVGTCACPSHVASAERASRVVVAPVVAARSCPVVATSGAVAPCASCKPAAGLAGSAVRACTKARQLVVAPSAVGLGSKEAAVGLLGAIAATGAITAKVSAPSLGSHAGRGLAVAVMAQARGCALAVVRVGVGR